MLAAALTACLATAQGMTVSSDSASYVGAARNAANGDGFRHPHEPARPDIEDGDPLTMFPIGYPAVLAAGSWLVGIFEAARLVNVAVAALNVWLTAALARRLGADRRRQLVAAGLIAVLPGVIFINSSLLSEPLFTALTLGGVVLLSRERLSVGAAGAAGGLIGAACMVRYAGIAFVVGGCVYLLLARYQPAWPRRVLMAPPFGLAASVPLGLLLIYNESVSGTAMGPRRPSDIGVGELLADFVSSWGDALAHHSGGLNFLVGALLLCPIAVGAWRIGARSWRSRSNVTVLGPVVMAVTYLAYVLVARLVVDFDDIAVRFIYPVLPMVAAVWVASDRSRLFRPVAIALLAVGVVGGGHVVAARLADGPQARPDLGDEFANRS